MSTREAIDQAVSFFVNVQKCESPSETDIRLVLNDLVTNHDYAQAWAVGQVKARLRKYREAIYGRGFLRAWTQKV